MNAKRYFTFFTANIIGFIFGLGICHPLIAHGLTGDHGRWLTPAQWVMHIIALLVFAFVYYQVTYRYISKLGLKVDRKRLTVLLFIPQLFFWLGYIAFDVPFDILFMCLGIAVINALALKTNFAKPRQWMLVNIVFVLLGFSLAAFLGYRLYAWMLANGHAHDLAGDFMMWLTISSSVSLIYGSLTSIYIKKQIIVSERV